MSDPQNPKTKSQVPVTPDAQSADQSDGQVAPKDYYYDDSTGYEVYEGPDEEDEGSAETINE